MSSDGAAFPVVPPQVADVMRPELGRAAEQVIDAIQREVPEYARPDDGAYTSIVRRAVHQAVQQFVLQIADPRTPREATAQLFRDIGRIEAAEGRSLEPLQAALRLGARVTWRMLCEQAARGRRASTTSGRWARPCSCTSTSSPRPVRKALPGPARKSRASWSGAAAGCWT